MIVDIYSFLESLDIERESILDESLMLLISSILFSIRSHLYVESLERIIAISPLSKILPFSISILNLIPVFC